MMEHKNCLFSVSARTVFDMIQTNAHTAYSDHFPDMEFFWNENRKSETCSHFGLK